MRLWVIVPTLNEAQAIAACVRSVLGQAVGCVVVDGGSRDATRELAAQAGARVITAPAGRARQMNAGAARVRTLDPACDHLLFLHADCRLPPDWALQLAQARGAWARFDVVLVPLRSRVWQRQALRIIAAFMNGRSALTGISTGDQGLLVPLAAFEAIGGFPAIPLMEDVEVSIRLRRHLGRPHRLRGPMMVSARRWEQHGLLRTVLAMWAYRLRYFFGESPESLHRRYYDR